MSDGKECTKCGVYKDFTEFYKQTGRKDGRRSLCKDCMNNQHDEYMQSNPEQLSKYRERGRTIVLTIEQKARKKERNRLYYLRDREKNRARSLFNAAVRNGTIKRQSCEICGETVAEGHHDDYSKPLEVRWLCTKHHGEVHRKY